MANKLEATRQKNKPHSINENLYPNEPELSPQDDNFSEVNVSLVVLFDDQVLEFIELTHHYGVLSILQEVSVNIDHQLQDSFAKTEQVLDAAPFQSTA